jgi:predicted transcriptional regulator
MANYTKEYALFCLPLGKKYRSQMEIIALILEAARYGGANFYSIMKRTSINYKQLKRYLPSLIKIGFMEAEIKGNRITFRVSENGLVFLRQYNILRDMLLGAYTGNDKQVGMVHEEPVPSNMQKNAVIPLTNRVVKRT